MIVVPFLFFFSLTVYWWKKHGQLDVCVYMAGLYAMTSFFAIIIVCGDMLGTGGVAFDSNDIRLGFMPTMLYCLFIALGILPFSMIFKRDLKSIGSRMPLLIDGLGVVLIAVSILNLYLVADSTLEILSGDLSTVRSDHYEGILSPAEVKAQSMPSIIKYFYYLNTATTLALPLWFYNISCRKVKWWYNALLLFASLSLPLAGIQAADRTESVFYALMFLFCYFFFNKMMSRKTKVKIYWLGASLAALIIIYLAAVSLARFEKREGGATQSIVQYTGQNYLNFCFFWEEGKFEYISPEREFPLTWHTLFGIDSNPERRSVRSGEQGFHMSIFASFIGDVMLDLSPLGMVTWTTYYFLICCIIIGKSHREDMDISEILLVFMAATVPVFGIFYYRLFSFRCTYVLIIVLLIYLLSKRKLVYR